MQTLFTLLICLQFLVVMLHDLVDIPGWNHGSQVKAVVGPTKYWIGAMGERDLSRGGGWVCDLLVGAYVFG